MPTSSTIKKEYKMPSHAEMSARLMRDAASFFRTIAEQNEPLKDQMTENAAVFEQVADLVESDPSGEIKEEAEEAKS